MEGRRKKERDLFVRKDLERKQLGEKAKQLPSWREVGEDVKRTEEHQRRRDVYRACLLDLRSYQGRISRDFALSSSPQ